MQHHTCSNGTYGPLNSTAAKRSASTASDILYLRKPGP
jgi:hypothetical protein